MAESDHGAEISLPDVTGASLTNLAQLSNAVIDTALLRLLMQGIVDDRCLPGGSKSRIWQNY
jgi:hypothetical protein